MTGSPSAAYEASDAARWWRGYVLAENDQEDELRELAAVGDDHARRQLASWLADRARTDEAIDVIRPLADAGDDVAELWLARWLADCDRLAELRERAESGGYHAARKLPCLLACHDQLDELRARAGRGDYHAWCVLIKTLADRDLHEELRERVEAADAATRQLMFDVISGSPDGPNALRVLADLGHKASRMHLGRRLARAGCLDELRQRAENGDEYAQHWLDEIISQS
jgi:hypothetical protein